jgi:hypothetical protein
MDLIHKMCLQFADAEETAGKVMHKKLIDSGYHMLFLPSETLGLYIDHINHATMVLNPELGAREKTIQQGQKRIEKRLAAVNATAILQNDQLDN